MNYRTHFQNVAYYTSFDMLNVWFSGCKPPSVNVDFVPREIKVKAGKNIEIEIPYTGQLP